ncbi:MAG TPA: hypothetical protein VHP31_03675 [Caproicibacter sp.]|nr:hypothetical protein [Caproicibacter sp.]
MNIIVHYPTEVKNQQELQKRVAAAHCNAIIKYIERLPCPTEQKKEILSQMIQDR